MTSDPSHHQCLACGDTRLTAGTPVAVAALARAWATDRAVTESGGLPPTADRLNYLVGDWEARIARAVGSPTIVFDRCQACGLEAARPRRCWPEGDYTEDEHYPVRWEFKRFLDDLGGPTRLLELGAGRGTFLGMASRRGHRAMGIDFNPVAVGAARANGFEVVRGGFAQLREHLGGAPGGPFDAVAMFHVIEHLPDPVAVLAGLAEFVRPGTRLGISCPGPNRFTPLIAVQQVGGRDFWDFPPHHVLRWTPSALRAVLTRLGWEVEAVAEEPLVVRHAASQIGVTRALWRGYHHRPLRRRVGLAVARLRAWVSWAAGTRGLSLYALARYRGG